MSDETIEILIDQVGRMTESITELRLSYAEATEQMRQQREADRVLMREEFDRTRQLIIEENTQARQLIVDSFAEVREGFAELKAVADRQAETQARQERNIESLVAVVKTLIEERRSAQ